MQNEHNQLNSYLPPDIDIIRLQDIDVVTFSDSLNGNVFYDEDENQAEWD